MIHPLFTTGLAVFTGRFFTHGVVIFYNFSTIMYDNARPNKEPPESSTHFICACFAAVSELLASAFAPVCQISYGGT